MQKKVKNKKKLKIGLKSKYLACSRKQEKK